jgi:hypothetical protein
MDDLGGRAPTAADPVADTILDEARRVAARRDVEWPPRPLTPGLRLLLWVMRAYVVLMLVVVAVQLLRVA